MTTVTVCVGSSCHIKGAREMIERFNKLVKAHCLDKQVELKGSFCMERCGEGVNWQIGDTFYSSSNVEEAVKIFEEQVIKPNLNNHTEEEKKQE